MERCLHSHKHIIETRFGFCSFLIMGLLLDILAIYAYTQVELSSDFFSLFMCILLLLFGLGLCTFGIIFYIIQTREYSVDSSGITVAYLGRYQVRFLWSEFESISICDIDHAAKDRDIFDIVIRLVAGKEAQGPVNKKQVLSLAGHDRWRGGGYNFIRFRRIIILDYSKDRYNLIKDLSGKEIADCITKYARGKSKALLPPELTSNRTGDSLLSPPEDKESV